MPRWIQQKAGWGVGRWTDQWRCHQKKKMLAGGSSAPLFSRRNQHPAPFAFASGAFPFRFAATGWLIGTRRWVIAIHASRLALPCPAIDRL